jgi:hypothetical protein
VSAYPFHIECVKSDFNYLERSRDYERENESPSVDLSPLLCPINDFSKIKVEVKLSAEQQEYLTSLDAMLTKESNCCLLCF